MAAGAPIPELSDAQADAVLGRAQDTAQQAFRWAQVHFPHDTDAAMGLAMSMLVQATGHAAAQCIGVTTDAARVATGAALASGQVGEATTSQHNVLMQARRAAGLGG